MCGESTHSLTSNPRAAGRGGELGLSTDYKDCQHSSGFPGMGAGAKGRVPNLAGEPSSSLSTWVLALDTEKIALTLLLQDTQV